VALHRRGLSIRGVARQLSRAPGSVARWTKMFIEGGDEGLDPIPNAGGTSRMTDADRLKLVMLLRLGARMNGFAQNLWTLRRVRDVIERAHTHRPRATHLLAALVALRAPVATTSLAPGLRRRRLHSSP
jgi:transposase